MALLTLIDQDLPRGGNEWDRVRDQYNAQHALIEGRDTRTTDSLKSRFRHVLAPGAPSGKTRCSALRTMVVEIQQRIMNKVHNVTVNDSENQSIVNSLPSTQASGAAEADSTSQQTEQPRLKRSRSATQIQPKHLQRSTKVEGAKPKRVIRDSGMSLWSRHREEQAAHRGNREIQGYLSVQNASLQEAKTALTNRLIALTSELDSKRGRISDLRDEKQQLIDGGIAT
ncbi:hypothetical protein PPTG_07717 [Phytophthora nicotianae INRA-310]|uniref:DUF6818 domain-containing protein n=1 Tax=Phytophthora nicotianae (strain INRA-310) TaxID=761204 RepID=W2QQD7_PHYN3|nr:hypothetical protein PPTG_07717 [Phytophthora nicotianae INRA-310]ETN14729.1 hypothetical protein PPTG_07717 [Phytophthora nicotianae INRA-310]